MVYQQFINYPAMTVYENIASPLRVAGADKARIEQEVKRAADLLKLTPYLDRTHGANSFIFYGKSGEIATNRLEDQELSVLCLHLLQISLVYINTLMLQQVLEDPPWLERLVPEDFRALSPLIYSHVNPYGSFDLDMGKRLAIDSALAFA
jgi:hypothetical protein